ncbi:hypothetical protein NYE69_28235 [Paenibacillus sp. FSL R5-0527]|uniref:hypothetical protein n=1 Tax=Paenibacillus sp. FSL R5-0527 TaxID=2975321 RepID=UPI00097B7C11|nr:hypothetical protein BK140_11170 [Paenibacillus macerans]
MQTESLSATIRKVGMERLKNSLEGAGILELSENIGELSFLPKKLALAIERPFKVLEDKEFKEDVLLEIEALKLIFSAMDCLRE